MNLFTMKLTSYSQLLFLIYNTPNLAPLKKKKKILIVVSPNSFYLLSVWHLKWCLHDIRSLTKLEVIKIDK